jgi:hypothetical protein
MLSVGSIYASRPIGQDTPAADAVERGGEGSRLPPDKVTLSPEARQQLRAKEAGDGQGQAGSGSDAKGQGPPPGAGRQLTEEQQRQVRELQQRDAHVRQHEAAHQAAGGDLTGPASYSYQTGPDGRSYAVGGEVQVAARSGRTPEETIAIARRVRAAAMAPADPSPADLAAAAQATQVELQAQQQQRAQAGQPGAGAAGAPRPVVRIGPTGVPQISLERLVVRSPEPEPIM